METVFKRRFRKLITQSIFPYKSHYHLRKKQMKRLFDATVVMSEIVINVTDDKKESSVSKNRALFYLAKFCPSQYTAVVTVFN